jgi:hypothetical protein
MLFTRQNTSAGFIRVQTPAGSVIVGNLFVFLLFGANFFQLLRRTKTVKSLIVVK